MGFFKSSSCLTELEDVIKDLLEVLKVKAYLQDAASSVIAMVVLDSEKYEMIISPILYRLAINNLPIS